MCAINARRVGAVYGVFADEELHVIPLYKLDDKPADIFSWEPGIFITEHAEWEAGQCPWESPGISQESAGPIAQLL